MEGTLGYFKDKCREVDSLCEVAEHPTVKYALLIRPSHPRYRDALREVAYNYVNLGVLVSIAKEVDDFGYPDPQIYVPAPRKTFLQRILGRFK
jgi:hypothetical protein